MTTEFAAGTTMAELAEAGTMTVGTKFDQPLFGLVGPDGVPVGFDVEIAKIIAAELGISEDNIKWTETVSANREPFIQDGRVDMVVATYTINDDRKEVVDFAGPYYEAGQSLMVRIDDDSISSEDDLAGKKVCSVDGSTPAGNIKDNYPETKLVHLRGVHRLPGSAAQRAGRRADHRQRDPRRVRGREPGRLQDRR